jgi:hypothetical protein
MKSNMRVLRGPKRDKCGIGCRLATFVLVPKQSSGIGSIAASNLLGTAHRTPWEDANCTL